MVESDKDDSILDSDEGEYHDTNVEITLCSGMQFQSSKPNENAYLIDQEYVEQCGCPPKRYQSEGESQKIIKENKENQSVNTNDSTLKKLRKCRSFQETGHDLQNCKMILMQGMQGLMIGDIKACSM
ncbi:hypothetical protein RhiirA4_424719 [Rhizophagus irregularis]|uniref:Uncharacterized protein n=1 Tax=Rhizophagus irregularis TaxID=588596 RepID=A0A2I1GYK9_9GLOM|nr:hypothetical protein RhiirA4_424719 [Rhizophagus irregularis]